MTTATDLDAVDALCAKVPDGPWYAGAVEACDGNVCIKHEHFDIYHHETRIADLDVGAGMTKVALSWLEANVACVMADAPIADFIAESRTLLPQLAAELRAARERMAEYETALTHYANSINWMPATENAEIRTVWLGSNDGTDYARKAMYTARAAQEG